MSSILVEVKVPCANVFQFRDGGDKFANFVGVVEAKVPGCFVSFDLTVVLDDQA